MRIVTDAKIIDSLISWRMVEQILPSRESLVRALESGKRLRFYMGFDPTGPDLHLGHSTDLFFLRDMQRLGHEIIFLVGDFTARIGDPTGRDRTRRPLSPGEIKRNMRTYEKQAAKLLVMGKGKNPAKLVQNSKWLSRLNLGDFVKLASHLTVQQLLERDMFARRTKAGRPISLHEFIYPLLQGYDSVALKTDAEVGGSDQLFNMMVGRKLLGEELKKSKFVITTKLLINPKTGHKLMSKSEGHYVALTAAPGEMYGAVMALPDEVLWDCFWLATDLADGQILKLKQDVAQGRRSLRDAKAYLAETIVSWAHGKSRVSKAREDFESVFVKKITPEDIEITEVKRGEKIDLIQLLVRLGLAQSKSEARRLIDGKAVEVNGRIVTDWREPIRLDHNAVVKVGKRKFFRVIVR